MKNSKLSVPQEGLILKVFKIIYIQTKNECQ